MSAALEAQVAEEQAEHDALHAADDPEPPDPEEEKDALFDKTRYDSPELALPQVDGEGVDKLAIAFSGTVLLDRADPRDVDLIRRMKLGADVTLMVEAKCSAKGHKFATDREGELDAVVLEHKAKVHTVYVSTADGVVPAGEGSET